MLCWCYVKSVFCFDMVVVIALLGSDLGTYRDEVEAMVCADQSDTSMANCK